MSRFTLAALILLAFQTALMPPGLCSCWLNPEVAAYHPHPQMDPHTEHDHGYLNDLAQADAPAVISVLAMLPQQLLALTGLDSTLSWRLLRPALFYSEWNTKPIAPPPKK